MNGAWSSMSLGPEQNLKTLHIAYTPETEEPPELGITPRKVPSIKTALFKTLNHTKLKYQANTKNKVASNLMKKVQIAASIQQESNDNQSLNDNKDTNKKQTESGRFDSYREII